MSNSKGWASVCRPAARVEGVQDRRCYHTAEALEARRGRRPGHPRHRTVRPHRRPVEYISGTGPVAPPDRVHPKITDAELVSLTVLQALLGAPAKPAGSGTPTRTCGTCSRTCRSSRPTRSEERRV